MKKFQFSLDNILGYRQQVLEAVQQEYAAKQALVINQENLIRGMEQEYNEFNQEFCRKKAEGMTMVEAMGSEGCLRALEGDIRKQMVKLMELQREAEAKREEMVLAKQDTSSTEKLREKKLDDYNKELQKGEEALIDELVAATWAINQS